MADQDQVLDYDGGSSSSTGSDLSGGISTYPSSPVGPSGGQFLTKYTNIARKRSDLPRINATFRNFNDPANLKFTGDSLKIVQKANTLDFLGLSEFFHPLQNFSEFQKQTFVIEPRTTVNLDPSSFSSTNGEVSMIIARAYYLPESEPDQRVLFWDYRSNTRNLMGQIMVLTGAVKNGYNWEGWDLSPFEDPNNPDPANIYLGGLSFTNPGDMNIKLKIIVAS